MSTKKRPGCLKLIMIVVGAFIVLSVIGTILSNKDSDSNSKTTSTKASESIKKENDGELFSESQNLFQEGKYVDALALVEQAIKVESKEEYANLKSNIESAIEKRKSELEAKFSIKNDKVENITFIQPSSGISKGLVFYPYIGIKDSTKYMLLRVGYQEPSNKALFVFKSIKVRAGETLEEIKFNPLEKLNNVDLLGSGMTEIVDVSVKKNIENLLSEVIPNNEEVIIRFEDVSNKSNDYTLTAAQKTVIANMLEYYSYLD